MWYHSCASRRLLLLQLGRRRDGRRTRAVARGPSERNARARRPDARALPRAPGAGKGPRWFTTACARQSDVRGVYCADERVEVLSPRRTAWDEMLRLRRCTRSRTPSSAASPPPPPRRRRISSGCCRGRRFGVLHTVEMAREPHKHGMPFIGAPTAEMLEDTDDGQISPDPECHDRHDPEGRFRAARRRSRRRISTSISARSRGTSTACRTTSTSTCSAPASRAPASRATPEWKRHHEPKNTADMTATIGQRLLWSLLVIGAHLFAATCFDAKAELVMLFGSIAQLYATCGTRRRSPRRAAAQSKPPPTPLARRCARPRRPPKLRAALEPERALGRRPSRAARWPRGRRRDDGRAPRQQLGRGERGGVQAAGQELPQGQGQDAVAARTIRRRRHGRLPHADAGRARPRSRDNRTRARARLRNRARACFPRDAHRSPRSPRARAPAVPQDRRGARLPPLFVSSMFFPGKPPGLLGGGGEASSGPGWQIVFYWVQVLGDGEALRRALGGRLAAAPPAVEALRARRGPRPRLQRRDEGRRPGRQHEGTAAAALHQRLQRQTGAREGSIPLDAPASR